MGQANHGEPLTSLENKGEELVFVAGGRQLGKVVLNKSSLAKNKSSRCGRFSLTVSGG